MAQSAYAEASVEESHKLSVYKKIIIYKSKILNFKLLIYIAWSSGSNMSIKYS